MGLGERLRDGWLTLIKNSLNHFTARQARAGRGQFWIVRHVGRTSGRTFETPIIARPVDGGYMIELTYGPQVNWYRNLVAANGGVLSRGGRDHPVHGLVPVSTEEGLAAFSPFQRMVLRILRRKHFVKLLGPET